MHYFDPHTKYDPPQKFRPTGPAAHAWTALYAGEVTYTDFEIGKHLKGMESMGLTQNALIIITADHGETLEEQGHGKKYEHNTVYEEVARVPLIMRLPKHSRPGAVVSAPVSTLDILPTILDVAGIPIPDSHNAQGISLATPAIF